MSEQFDHRWVTAGGVEVCAACGVVRRFDSKNKPCRGVVRIVPRGVL